MTITKTLELEVVANTSKATEEIASFNKELEGMNAKFNKGTSGKGSNGGAGSADQIKNLNKIHNAEVKQTRFEKMKSLFTDRERRKETQHQKQTERADKARAKHQEAEDRRARRNEAIQRKNGVTPGGPPKPPVPTPGGGGGGGPGMMGGMAAMGAGLLVSGIAAAVGAAVGYAVSTLKESYGDAVNYLGTVSELTGVEHSSLRDSKRIQQSERMGFSREDTARQMSSIAEATGYTDPVYQAQRLSRTGSMVGVEEQASFMNTLARAGTTFAGGEKSQGNMGMLQVMRNAVSSGLDRSRTGEFMQATASLIEQTASHTMAPIDTSGITALLGAVGALGGTSWQGAAGAHLLGGIDQGLRGLGQVGNMSAASAQAYQAIGYGAPGSDLSYYEATKRLQGGLFKNPEEGVQNLSQILDHARRSTSSREESNMFLAQGIFKGMDLEQIEHIVQMFEGGNFEELTKMLSDFEGQTGQFGTVEEKSLGVLQEQAKAANRSVELMEDQVASIQNLQAAFREMTQAPLEACVRLLSIIVDGMRHILRATGWDGQAINESASTGAEVGENIKAVANDSEFQEAKTIALVSRRLDTEDSDLHPETRAKLDAAREQVAIVRAQAASLEDPAAKARLMERLAKLEKQLETPGWVAGAFSGKREDKQVDPSTVSSQQPPAQEPVTVVNMSVMSGEPNSGPIATASIFTGPGAGGMSSLPMSSMPQ